MILYDEHGGFYDHVSPPAINDGSGYASLGVRVPAILVGPRIGRSGCHQTFDHTSLIKTILTRFAPDPDQAIRAMGQRVLNAPHLGIVLRDSARDDIPSHHEVRTAITDWRANATAIRRGNPRSGPVAAPDGAGQALVLQDFQNEFARFALPMREILPSDQP